MTRRTGDGRSVRLEFANETIEFLAVRRREWLLGTYAEEYGSLRPPGKEKAAESQSNFRCAGDRLCRNGGGIQPANGLDCRSRLVHHGFAFPARHEPGFEVAAVFRIDAAYSSRSGVIRIDFHTRGRPNRFQSVRYDAARLFGKVQAKSAYRFPRLS